MPPAPWPVGGFSVDVEFTDGSCRVIDLAPYLRGSIFEPIRCSADAFGAFAVDHEFGALLWPNGANVGPDVLFEGLAPVAWERDASVR